MISAEPYPDQGLLAEVWPVSLPSDQWDSAAELLPRSISETDPGILPFGLARLLSVGRFTGLLQAFPGSRSRDSDLFLLFLL